jgi:L-lactate dehydrogenase complex protein LldF
MSNLANFLRAAEAKAFDPDHRQKLNNNIRKYLDTVAVGKQQYSDLETARKRAKNIKHRTIEQLDIHLIDFEKNFTRNGGTVIWANDAAEAVKAVIHIARARDAKRVVKAKSMVTEEIELNHHLEKAGLQVFETDLGEFIQQLDGEKPYHIVTPAMHKSKEDVARLFHEKLGTDEDLTPEQLTMVARQKLREEYLRADIGISGANFIIADTGSIALTENEGNARLSTTFPKVHIAIVGIEKVIPSIKDLGLFWPLLATYGTGQNVTVYSTILSGPKRENEADGPEEMYVILLDNGRTSVLGDPDVRESMYCIRCGACLNVCPIYKSIGGHSYATTYSGPIGSIITPHLRGMEEFKHLSQASSLCGACTETCPVRIDLHHMLLLNRKKAVERKLEKDKWMWRLWRRAMLSRRMMNRGSSGLRNFGFRVLLKKSWAKRRSDVVFPKKSFNKLWTERQKN